MTNSRSLIFIQLSINEPEIVDPAIFKKIFGMHHETWTIEEDQSIVAAWPIALSFTFYHVLFSYLQHFNFQMQLQIQSYRSAEQSDNSNWIVALTLAPSPNQAIVFYLPSQEHILPLSKNMKFRPPSRLPINVTLPTIDEAMNCLFASIPHEHPTLSKLLKA